MSTPQDKRKLGDIVYYVNDDGTIERSMICEVGLKGPSSVFAKGYMPPRTFYNFADASVVALKLLQVTRDALMKSLAKLTKAESAIRDGTIKTQLDAAPLRRRGGDELPPLQIPQNYLQPGTIAYGCVTPKTHNSVTPHYRPRPYFVLEVVVESVRITHGVLEYGNSSHYYFGPHLFASPAEACQRLTEEAKKDAITLSMEDILLVTKAQFEGGEQCVSEQVRSRVTSPRVLA